MADESALTGLVDKKTVAAVFGVKDRRTVDRWEAAGFPVAVRGRGGKPNLYRLPDCIAWYVEREVKARSAGEHGDLNPTIERARLDAKRREELDLRIRLRRGELLERAHVVHAVTACNRAVMMRLRRVPSACIVQVAQAVRAQTEQAGMQIMLEHIDHALTELATYAGTLTEEENDDAA